MAKKITKIGIMGTGPTSPPQTPVPSKTTTPVRGSAIPRPAGATEPARGQITHEMIAKRAFEVWQSSGGPELDNWLRAERELRGH